MTRLRQKVAWEVKHVYYNGGSNKVHLWDGIVYLGKHKADRAGHPVRLIRITTGGQTYTYLTDVLDPRQLPAWQVAQLYRRRWDIEKALDLIKTHLGLHLLWSAFPNVILHQIYATIIIAQIALALRSEIARRAGADLREVSLPLLLRWLPQLAAMGRDPIHEFATYGRKAGYIRPFRGKAWQLPHIPEEEYLFPPALPPPRKARYGSRDYNRRCQHRQKTDLK